MLNPQTRREVRGAFTISFIQEKVEVAKKRYLEVLPEIEKKFVEVCSRFTKAMNDVRSGGNDCGEYLKVLQAFAELKFNLMDGFRGHRLKGYDETIAFLTTIEKQTRSKNKTLMLSQLELMALDKDDTTLRDLLAAEKSIERVQAQTASYGVGVVLS